MRWPGQCLIQGNHRSLFISQTLKSKFSHTTSCAVYQQLNHSLSIHHPTPIKNNNCASVYIYIFFFNLIIYIYIILQASIYPDSIGSLINDDCVHIMDYNQSCYWQSGLPISGHHHQHTAALPGAFLPTVMCWGWTHGGAGVGLAAVCPLPPASSACAAAPALNWGSPSGGEPQISEGLRRGGSQRRSTFSGS